MAIAPASYAAYFPMVEIAKFCGVDRSTARKWFEEERGVVRYPRGNQKPALFAREELVRRKLTEIGYDSASIDRLVGDHYAKVRAQEERRIKAREAKAAPPPKKKVIKKSKASARRKAARKAARRAKA